MMETFGTKKAECWEKSYVVLVSELDDGAEWGKRFWKNWAGSMASARGRGWKMVQVKVTEVRR
jgi:hypothetical protein